MKSAWTDKKVTVTGGAGFLGQHLVKRLEALGATVFVPRQRDFNLTALDACLRCKRPNLSERIRLPWRCVGPLLGEVGEGEQRIPNLRLDGVRTVHRELDILVDFRATGAGNRVRRPLMKIGDDSLGGLA